MFPSYFSWEHCSSSFVSGEPGTEVPPLPLCAAKLSPSGKVDIGTCAKAPVAGPRDRSIQTTSPMNSSHSQKGSLRKRITVSVQELDLLLCPVCFTLPLDQVYFCSNGHSFCDECAKTLNLCPMCMTDFKKESMRNYALERLLDLKRFQCLYKEDGCRRTDMNRKQLAKHLYKCGFNPGATRLCSIMNFRDWKRSIQPQPCQYGVRLESILNNSDHIYDFINHLSRCHRFSKAEIHLTTGTTTILEVGLTKLSSSGNRTHPKNEIFCNLIIKTSSGNDYTPHGLYFLLIRLDYQEGESRLERNLSLACVRLTPPSLPDGIRNDGQIMFSIKGSPLRGISDISWMDHPLTLEQVTTLLRTEAMQRPKFKFSPPMSFLQENYMTPETAHGKLTLHIDLTNTWHFDGEKKTGIAVKVVKPRSPIGYI